MLGYCEIVGLCFLLVVLEMKFRKNIMYTAPFAFLQPHNQIFFQVSNRNFRKNFVCS